MALFSQLRKAITQSEYYDALMNFHRANGVPTSTWLSIVNIGLSLTQYVSEVVAQLDSLFTETFRSLFLEEWQGLLDGAANDADRARIEERFRTNARNFYGIEAEPAQLQVSRFITTTLATAPIQTLAAGSIAGTSGNGILWASQIETELVPSQTAVIEFAASSAGSQHNVPLGTPIELKNTLVGVSISNLASGPATKIGAGDAGLFGYSAQSGVTISVVNHGPLLPLVISANLGTKTVTVQLRTDAGAVAQSTAEEVRKAINGVGGDVAALVLYTRNQGTGASVMEVGATLLGWDGTYIASAGSDVESALRLKRRCETRLDTIGGGGGLGLPPGLLGTEDALVFWGLATPTDYAASPVRWVRVLSNNKLGVISGGESTVILASDAGLVTAVDVSAVAANYENPRKYWGVLHVTSAVILTIPVVCVVHVRTASGRTLAEVQEAVAEAFTEFLDTIGDDWSRNSSPTVYSNKVIAVIDGADPTAISWVEWTGFLVPVVLAWNEFPEFNTAGITYQYG